MSVMLRTRRARSVSAPVALERVAAKQWVVEQVIAGRLSLVAAAASFRTLGPAADDLEGACRTVIGWAGLALGDRPELAARVVERLEEELRRYQRQADGLRLSAPT